jgi:hypothetical protein
MEEPELPEIKDLFHIQLAWAEPLSKTELDALFAGYETLLTNHILMCRESLRRGGLDPGRSGRERLIWTRIEEGRVAAYEAELSWARSLRKELGQLGKAKEEG